MSDDSTYDLATETLAATFIDRESAHDALTELYHAGFRRSWLGVTRAGRDGETSLATEDAGPFAALGRFFRGEGTQSHALHAALVRHGLSPKRAHELEATLSPGNAVVVVDGENDVDEAIRLLRQSGGDLSPDEPVRTPVTDAGESGRMQLREERLRVGKEREAVGEARVGKRVVSETQSLDVPVFHEELYVERRPAGDRPTSGTIGDGTEIRVPLEAERVDVRKETVATENVAVRKRGVAETEHISETVRREELQIDGRDERAPRDR